MGDKIGKNIGNMRWITWNISQKIIFKYW